MCARVYVYRLVARWAGQCTVRTEAEGRLLGWFVWSLQLARWRRHSSIAVCSFSRFSYVTFLLGGKRELDISVLSYKPIRAVYTAVYKHIWWRSVRYILR